MSRAVMQQALEALEYTGMDVGKFNRVNAACAALRAALAEPDSDYERGFVDGMNMQTKRSVDKVVNRMAQNQFGDDAEGYARKLHEERESYKALFTERKPQTTHWEGCEAVHPECRKPEQEPVAWMDDYNACKCPDNEARCFSDKVFRMMQKHTTPPQRKPLTDEELEPLLGALPCYDIGNSDLINFARAVIAAYEAKQGEQA